MRVLSLFRVSTPFSPTDSLEQVLGRAWAGEAPGKKCYRHGIDPAVGEQTCAALDAIGLDQVTVVTCGETLGHRDGAL